MSISETSLTVRYAETDQMGIVHHSNYAVWFEAGRTDFIRKMGLPYSKIEESGALLPLVELRCFFRGTAKYEDEIVVRTSVSEYNGIKLTFHYDVCLHGSGRVITEGETVHAWTNRDLKPVNLKKFRPEIHKLIMEAFTNEPICP
jgi:acyl-CoA thioester hydrolase